MENGFANAAPSFIDGLIAGATTPAPLIFGTLMVLAACVLVWNAVTARRGDASSTAAPRSGEVVPLERSKPVPTVDSEGQPRRAA